MKIGINAIWLKPGLSGGIEIYFRNLISNLSRYDQGNKYYIFLNSRKLKQQIQSLVNSNVQLVYLPQLEIYMYAVLYLLLKHTKTFFQLIINKIWMLLFSTKIWDIDTTQVYSILINFER